MPAPMQEFELIARLRARLEEAGVGASPRVVVGSGDDAAVFSASGATAVSVDAVVEGVHFRFPTAPPRAVGRKALAAALSDLAAIGAGPAEAYVVLGLPAEDHPDAFGELLEGLVEGAERWSVTLAGGDITRAPVVFVSVTVIGELDSAEAVRRGGARPGQLVTLTGELGGAAAGLLLLEREELAAALPEELGESLRRRQLAPEPLLAAGQALARTGAEAMIDLSDGLGADAGHVAAASGATLEIDLERVPVAAGVEAVADAAGTDPLDLAIAGGEDYELLACLSPGSLEAATKALERTGTSLTVIGSVAAGAGEAVLRDASGTVRSADGHDHFAAGSGRSGST